LGFSRKVDALSSNNTNLLEKVGKKDGKRKLVSPKMRPFREPFRNRPEHLPEGWQDIFLDEMRMQPVVARAARLAGVSRRTAYAYKETDAEFAAAWLDAEAEGKEKSLEILTELAENGNVQAAIKLTEIHGFKPKENATKPGETKVTVGWEDN